MHIADILMYGHKSVLAAVEGLPDPEWDVPGVTTAWSVKDVIAHLASFEQVLADVLTGFAGGGPTPHLDAFQSGGNFNQDQVAKRRARSPKDVLREYQEAHTRIRALVPRIPAAQWREAGTLPWYGAEYDLEDFVVYTNYAHKREHGGQIRLFRKRLEQQRGRHG